MSEEENSLAVVDAAPRNTPITISGTALLLNGDAMGMLRATAQDMAMGKTTVPKHLQGNVGDCMAVCMQAAQWNMNPYSVAQKTHIVNGALGYEAQLCSAVLVSTGAITGQPDYEWFGDWRNCNGQTDKSHDRGIIVRATLTGETKQRELIVTMGEVGVRNSPLWAQAPRIQLSYLGIKRWGRLYAPGALLGFRTPDEFEHLAPKSMGAAHVIVPEPSAELTAQADAAAKAGVTAYSKFWQSPGIDPEDKSPAADNFRKENRKALAAGHEERKRTALQVDADRTIDNAAQAAPARAVPMFSVEKVESFLNEAQDEDELNAAADLTKHFTDPADVKRLDALYDTRLKAIRKE